MSTSPEKRLIFIHGWATDRSVWDGLAQKIAGVNPFSNINLPGHGGKRVWDEPTLKPAMKEVLDLMEGRRGPIVAIGWSLGAQTIIALASEFPDLFKGIILVGATARFCADTDNDQSYGQSKALVRRMIMDMKKAPAETLQSFYSLNFTPEELLTEGARMFIERYRYPGPVECRETPPGCFPAFRYNEITRALEALCATDLTGSLGAVKAETLLIHGGRDNVCHVNAAIFLASAIKGARLEIFEDAGHGPFITEPERFASCVKGFLDGL